VSTVYIRGEHLKLTFPVALAIPTGVASDSKLISGGDILSALEHAENLYSSGLETFTEHGTVQHLRGAAISLALIKTFHSFLGRTVSNVPTQVTQLLGTCGGICSRRVFIFW
jgi:separase